MEKDFSAAIVGAGQLGSAVGSLLSRKNIVPTFWDKDPSRAPDQKSLEDTVRSVRCVLLCVPSWAMRRAILDVSPFLNSDAILVSFAKGIELETGKTMSELLVELLPANRSFAVVGGPMLAGEIMDKKRAVGVFASSDANAREMLDGVFSSSDFAVELEEDVLSVSVAGVLKNIYAVGLGMAHGLDLGENVNGWFASIAIREMTAIASILGADPKIIGGVAGIGDFVATAWSPNSQNRQIGVEIAKTGTCATRGEGLVSIVPLTKRLGASAVSFPLLNLIAAVGIDCQAARPAFDAFFAAMR